MVNLEGDSCSLEIFEGKFKSSSSNEREISIILVKEVSLETLSLRPAIYKCLSIFTEVFVSLQGSTCSNARAHESD